MKEWEKYLVPPHVTLLEAMRYINDAGGGFGLVADENRLLLGTVTDGNIRRGLLSGRTLQDRVDTVLTMNPTTAAVSDTRRSVLQRMKKSDFTFIPVVDDHGTVVGMWARNELQSVLRYENPVVLMAGGLGSRLGELTRDCPKPMLQIGGKPILEIVLQSFIDCGFSRFFFAVNYKAEQVERHFGDGNNWHVSIEYLKEEKPLGTAGALSLLPESIELPFIVMNGDILTRLQANELLEEHEVAGGAATMAIKAYDVHIPYGVIEQTQEGGLQEIREKPSFSFPVSAGVNAFSPEVLQYVPRDTKYDMPDLFQALLKGGKHVHTVMIDDYWLDVGYAVDYEKANREYRNYFTSSLL